MSLVKKVFVSGQVDDVDRVREVYKKLELAGFVITHDWTVSDVILSGREAKLKNTKEAGLRAEKDINGVVDADVYILLSDNEKVGKGMYAELGAALALHKGSGTPDIYIVGSLNHLSVFYLHPAVRLRDTIEDVLNEL